MSDTNDLKLIFYVTGLFKHFVLTKSINSYQLIVSYQLTNFYFMSKHIYSNHDLDGILDTFKYHLYYTTLIILVRNVVTHFIAMIHFHSNPNFNHFLRKIIKFLLFLSININLFNS